MNFIECFRRSSISTMLMLTLYIIIIFLCSPSDQSIGYFENYGWPSYGIVKPFWLAPFSTYPTAQTSGYSRSARILSAGVVLNAPGTRRNVIGY
ncbi:hypothetical protein HUG17_6958 [Dermatophagoides farinae]|uniref:Uncharacterized protein n=1 Tax=Dermatophagoides farinae TaxID=6954 RepID=A0A9D4NRW8_DERFA|nr:hypothetical protein HUG17_6958 [Dermatophagoides farinae]